jgi:type I restriction enzyme S subunit
MSTKKPKQTDIGTISEDWEEKIFSEAIDVNPKRELKKGIENKFVSMGDLKESDKRIHGYTIKKFSGGSKFINGDTLMARITPCLENGKTAFVDILNDEEVGSGSTEFIVLSAKEGKTIPHFVYYTAISQEIRKTAIKSMTGTSGRQRVENDIFDKITISLPPILEQEAIAGVLKSLDDKIALNRSMNSTLEAIGQALFRRWFVDFEFPNEEGKPYRSSGGEMVDSELGEVPRGWKVVSFDEIVEVRGGSTPKTENPTYWNGDIPWITPKDLTTSERIHFSKTSRYITKAGLENISKNLIPSGSVLLSSRAPIGYVAINDVPMATNQGFINIICSNQINSLFLFFWLKFNKERLLSFANGTTFQELSKSSFKKIKLILPHQTQMNLFKAIISPMDLQIANNHDEIEKISLIRDALLPKLMSGEIRVSTNSNLNNENK